MIASAGYFRAEKRGFSGGCELEDWLEAETEIDKLMWHGLAPQSVGSKGDAK